MKYKVKNVEVKPNSSEEHSISVEIELEIFARAFGSKEVNLIQDMYSPSVNLKINEKMQSTMVNMKNTRTTVTIKEKVSLDDVEYNKVNAISVNTMITEKNVLKDMVKVNGTMDFKVVLANDEDTDLRTKEFNIPFNFSQEIDGIDSNSMVDIELENTYKEFTKDNMEGKINVNLEANTNSYNIRNIGVIDNVEETEYTDDNPYSMVIYFVKPNDTLWKIAKKYRSTVSDIARINNIENPEKISVGMQLFIPKCSMHRVETPANV